MMVIHNLCFWWGKSESEAPFCPRRIDLETENSSSGSSTTTKKNLLILWFFKGINHWMVVIYIIFPSGFTLQRCRFQGRVRWTLAGISGRACFHSWLKLGSMRYRDWWCLLGGRGSLGRAPFFQHQTSLQVLLMFGNWGIIRFIDVKTTVNGGLIVILWYLHVLKARNLGEL